MFLHHLTLLYLFLPNIFVHGQKDAVSRPVQTSKQMGFTTSCKTLRKNSLTPFCLGDNYEKEL